MADDAPDGPEPPRRLPASVYGVGSEPDARFSMANERTFLAWIRTSVGLLAAGVVLTGLELPIRHSLAVAGTVLLAVTAALSAVWSWLSWARSERALRLERPLPGLGAGGLLGLVIVAVVVIVVVGLLLGPS